MTGMFMGTPGYLAPEVIEGKPPAARPSDVHSWAATLAFAATGRPPFGTGPFETIFYRIINGPPDLAAMPAAADADGAARPGPRPGPPGRPAAELADRAGCLDPAALLPSEAAHDPARPRRERPGRHAGATMGDVSARPVLAGLAGGAAAAALPAVRPAPPAPVPAAGWSSGTSPLAARPPDNFADLLPPVDYRHPLAQPGLGRRAWPSPVRPRLGQPAASPADGRGRPPTAALIPADAGARGRCRAGRPWPCCCRWRGRWRSCCSWPCCGRSTASGTWLGRRRSGRAPAPPAADRVPGRPAVRRRCGSVLAAAAGCCRWACWWPRPPRAATTTWCRARATRWPGRAPTRPGR